jgi:4-amino-4-deoxy-L-arabinose transferase-like glycosyltransferase
MLLSLLWLLVLAQNLERSPRLALWAGFGLLAGLAGLNEPSLLVVVPFLMVLACWRLSREGKRWLLPATVASLALAAALSPWMIRNALVFHRFIPMRDSMGLELWMGNNGYTECWTSDQLHPLHDKDELADYDRMGELAYMDRKKRQAEGFIAQHPEWFVWTSLRRAVYLWTGYWSFDRGYLAMEPTDPANIPFATSLTLLAIAGLILAWHEQSFEALRFGGVLVLFPIIYYLSHPEPYHMRPLDPLLVILVCQALVAWRERARESEAFLVTEVVQEA